MKRVTSIMAALVFTAAAGAAGAQTVYKCKEGSYSDQNCASRVVRTYDSPVPVTAKARDGASRRLPGETVAEFNVRKRRGHMKETDRDECARLDKRIPFEQERAKTNNEDEVDAAQAALDISRKRFKALGC
ncbi:hypothetical protein [Ramlibacter sp. PS4R-6]|uniref:hypothetical protein n=1 Tax=Ramlibacter sp. PS4R-6 TaxID=3133438 RepID=UPI0030B124FB